MRDLKLYQALEIWFGGQQENQDAKYQEAEKYLRLRIRPAMEILLEEEDTERMQCLEEQVWFGRKELDGFIYSASEKEKLRSLIWLLHLKNEKYGYTGKDFSL